MEKLKKPRPDFPLFCHVRGYWCKKVRGKLHYFGKIANDPKGRRPQRYARHLPTAQLHVATNTATWSS